MISRYYFRYFFVFTVVAVCLLPFQAGMAADQRLLDEAVTKAIKAIDETGGREITLTAVERTVTTLKDPIVGSGSHVSGLYTPKSSDHDFTMLLGSDLGPDEALEAWKTARSRFSLEIKNETLRQFETNLRQQLRQAGITDPAEINRLVDHVRPQAQGRVQQELVNGILERTNLYPPDMLMQNASGSDDARRIFREMQTVPNLGVEDGANLTDAALKKATDGVYGPGSKAYRQWYERTAGVVWEIDPKTGVARKYPVDLTHFSQGYGLYTIEGTSNTAGQWSDLVLGDLAEGNNRAAFKHLERLHLDMRKARDLASIPSPGSTGIEGFYNQYNDIKKTARELYPGDAAAQSRHVRETIENLFQSNPGLKSQIQRAVGTAKKEARLLSQMTAESAVKRKAFIRNMLDVGSESGSRLKNALNDLYDTYGHHASFGNFLSAIFIALDTAEAASRHGRGDVDGAIRKAFDAVLSIPPTLLPAGLMASITNMIIDSAKDAGYSLAVSSQDCEDFLAGIISVKGWEYATSFPSKFEMNITELARRYSREDEVKRFVETVAHSVSTGQAGTQAINIGKETALVEKCTPQILGKWRAKRQEYVYEYIDIQNILNQLFSNLNVRITANPNPAHIENRIVDVSIQLIGSDIVDNIKEILLLMRNKIEILGGSRRLVTQSVYQKTECFINDNSTSFYHNEKIGIEKLIDSTIFSFTDPGISKISCNIKWDVVVISSIGDPGDYATTSLEILRPLVNLQLPRYEDRVVPGCVISTHRDQLDRTYSKTAQTFIRVEAGKAPDPVLSISPPAEVAAGEGRPGKPYTFTALAEHIPDSAEYAWHLDGMPLEGRRNVVVSFPGKGVYTLSVTATWSQDEPLSAVITVQIDDEEVEEEAIDSPSPGDPDTSEARPSVDSGDGQHPASDVPQQESRPIPDSYGPSGQDDDGPGRTPWAEPQRPADIDPEPESGDQPDPPGDQPEDPRDAPQPDTPPDAPQDQPDPRDPAGERDGPPGDDVPDTQPPGQDPDSDPAAPPACTYEYSEWGTCDRDSEKQTRFITGKSPDGCVDSGQPSLEQGCKPPPTQEERHMSFLHCLCSYSKKNPYQLYNAYYDGRPTACLDDKSVWAFGSGPCRHTGNSGECIQLFLDPSEENKRICYVRHLGDGSQDTWDKAWVDALIKEENDKAKLPLELKLNIEECPITVQLGEIVTFTATPKGGIPPYTYFWSGNGQAEEQKFTFANSRQPGTHPVSVTVSDSDGSSATVECPIIVDVVTVTIEKTSPPANVLSVGGKASFRATVTSADKPVRGELIYHWEPHPEVQFGDEANPQHETTSPSTTATYLRPGDVGMWVSVLQKEGEISQTIGESDQLFMSIVQPTLTLTADKDQPWVGDTVVVTVKEEEAMKDDDIAFVWEVQGDVLSAGAAPNVPNHRAHSFVFKDNQPVTVTVRARTKVHGDDLGEASIVLEAQGYKVRISGPEYRGPKPRIWKCDGQLGTAADCKMVEVDQDWAVFRDLRLTASVEPEPEKGPVRYRWSIKPEGICGIPGTGKELTINCSQIGLYKVELVVWDSQGVELGNAEEPVNITISQEDQDEMMVSLDADPASIQVGETATIQAEVAGGTAPLTYTWSANVQGADQTATFAPTAPGAQTITVQVADADGKTGEAEIDLDVEPEPLEVALTGEPMSIKVGETTTLTATVTGGMPDYSYAWTGAAGSGASVEWTPDEPEDREIGVQVTDSRGETSTANLVVAVQPLPLEVDLSADSVEVKLGDDVAFQAEVRGGKPDYSHEWVGVDGQGAGATWKAESSGVHMVGIQVTDADGQTASAEVEVNVTAPPLKVALSADKKDIRVGESVQFTAKVTGGEPDFRFAWGGGPHGQGNVASWSPDEHGDYDVTVEVTDKGGQVESAVASIKVQPPLLEVSLVADKTEVSQWDWVTLTAEVTGGLPEFTATWSDGVSGKDLEGTFFAKNPGKQTLSVTVRDKSRQTASARITLDVEDKEPVIVDESGPLSVELSADQTRIAVGRTATLRALASGGAEPYTYSWSQAVQDNGETGLFTPTATGYYQLFVEVRDAKQVRQTARIDIQVEQGAADAPDPAAPVAGGPLAVRLVPERTTLAQGESMTIQALASGGREPYAYSWSRTVHGAEDTVVFAPKDTGFYQIFVEVRDADFQRMTAQVDVQVQQGAPAAPLPHPQPTPAPTVVEQPKPEPPRTQEPVHHAAPPAVPTQSPIMEFNPADHARHSQSPSVRTIPEHIDREKLQEIVTGLEGGTGNIAETLKESQTTSTGAPISKDYSAGTTMRPQDRDREKDKDKRKGRHDGENATKENEDKDDPPSPSSKPPHKPPKCPPGKCK